MNTFGIKEIASILEMLEKHDVTEFRLERGEEKISLRRGRPVERRARPIPGAAQMMSAPALPSNVIPLMNTAQPQPMQGHHAQPMPNAPMREQVYQETSQAPSMQVVETLPKRSLKEITSPMVGTFYRRPAVDAEPYVNVGDSVKKGDVLCIVEAMKLMNEIESDMSGKIAEICLEDGQMVEYGEVLFRIES